MAARQVVAGARMVDREKKTDARGETVREI
jgi:hypothetical protein